MYAASYDMYAMRMRGREEDCKRRVWCGVVWWPTTDSRNLPIYRGKKDFTENKKITNLYETGFFFSPSSHPTSILTLNK